jgi:N-acetyl-alpha-D-glucosaminyl L-malate synthase BshA
MRIGICCYPTYGGSGAVATDLGLSLAQAGHEVHFVSYARPARLTGFHPNVTFHRVSVTPYPLFKYPPYDLALASLLRDVAESRALDVLHVHYAMPHAVSAVLARDMLGTRLPRIVTTLHGTDITIVGADRAYFRPTLYGIERSDAVTTVSQWLRQETLRFFRPTRAVEVIPNAVDVARFKPAPACEMRAAVAHPGELIVSHVSNFRPVKRVADVVHIFAGVAARLPARLLLAGDGPDVGLARATADACGVADRVHFLGEQEDVERVYQASDLFLLPSEQESFGLAALEALACGVPVAGYRSGGLPEVVRDGETGILVETGEVDEASRRCVSLLGDAARRARFAKAARDDAVGRFAEPDVVARYVAIYERVLNGG